MSVAANHLGVLDRDRNRLIPNDSLIDQGINNDSGSEFDSTASTISSSENIKPSSRGSDTENAQAMKSNTNTPMILTEEGTNESSDEEDWQTASDRDSRIDEHESNSSDLIPRLHNDSTEQMNSENIGDLPADIKLVVYTSQSTLYLASTSNLEPICELADLNWPESNMPYSRYFGLDRLSLMKWIPDISLVIVASQQGVVSLVRLIRSEKRIGMVIIIHIDCRTCNSQLLIGIDCVPIKSTSCTLKLQLLLRSGSLLTYHIIRQE